MRDKRSKRAWWFEGRETAGVIASIFRLSGAWVGLGLNFHASTSHEKGDHVGKIVLVVS